MAAVSKKIDNQYLLPIDKNGNYLKLIPVTPETLVQDLKLQLENLNNTHSDEISQLIWVRHIGNSEGPVVFSCHGGPGDASTESHLQRFDLDQVQVIQIDQRGCGKSLPIAQVEGNTTERLLEDMEQVRSKLELEQILVSGSSWGASLAILYTQKYPEKVGGLYLRSPFLARGTDSSIVYNWAQSEDTLAAAQQIKPDLYSKFVDELSDELGLDHFDSDYLWNMISTENSSFAQKQQIAKFVLNLEFNLYSQQSEVKLLRSVDISSSMLNMAKIYLHYHRHNYFLESDQILQNMHKVAHIPTIILQGRYDLLCSVAGAWELHNRFEDCILEIVEDSGHKLTATANRLGYYMFKILIEKLENSNEQ